MKLKKKETKSGAHKKEMVIHMKKCVVVEADVAVIRVKYQIARKEAKQCIEKIAVYFIYLV